MSNLLYVDQYKTAMDMAGHFSLLDKKRVFLTGCSGFIGQWLMETFWFSAHTLGIDMHMTGLCRRPMRADCPYLDVIQGDVRTFDFPDGRYDYIIHAAGGYGPDTFQTSVHGTERVLEFARHAGVKRILYLSSGAIYYSQPHLPEHAYGEGKRAAEMLCVSSGLEVRIARLFSFVGPLMDFDKYAIGKFIKGAVTDGKVRVKGGRNVKRSYMYAADLVDHLWYLLLNPDLVTVYNVGSPTEVTVREAAEMVADVCGVPIEEEEGEYPDNVYVCPPGNNPRIPLRDAIEKTVAWYKEVNS